MLFRQVLVGDKEELSIMVNYLSANCQKQEDMQGIEASLCTYTS